MSENNKWEREGKYLIKFQTNRDCVYLTKISWRSIKLSLLIFKARILLFGETSSPSNNSLIFVN